VAAAEDTANGKRLRRRRSFPLTAKNAAILSAAKNLNSLLFSLSPFNPLTL
jgi:hypothetical protein